MRGQLLFLALPIIDYQFPINNDYVIILIYSLIYKRFTDNLLINATPLIIMRLLYNETFEDNKK